MEFMMNGDYIIITTLFAGDKKFEKGINQHNGSFATWEIREGKRVLTRCFSDRDSATEDLCTRTLEELSLKKQNDKEKENVC